MKSALYAVLDAPMSWSSFPVLFVGGGITGNVIECGLTLSAVGSGLMVGVVLFGVFACVRRRLVGHWR